MRAHRFESETKKTTCKLFSFGPYPLLPLWTIDLLDAVTTADPGRWIVIGRGDANWIDRRGVASRRLLIG
jgi:hypothetical protein